MAFYYVGAAVIVAGLARIWFLWRTLLRQLPNLSRHLVLF
ncbi:hypothetical protein LMG26788_02895 [Achromobacter pulmonis]|uniref:Uncharacterized protein n=1 Tax=Achromobacter pulmonis TaxID=1389932 RepID=A0A6S7D5J9_9BURK|nr:hypothetical protein LMG26696_02267 [Achromobacter pulmonis]CAB3873350.1 hypothetical protein LMG26788_02895 [Achromobacter pulmonis]